MKPYLCVGGAQIGMPYGIANTSGPPDGNEVAAIVQGAKEHGIRHYDTGQSYGDSESRLGEAFADLKVNQLVQCITKIHPETNDQNPTELIQRMRRSIDRLRVPRLWALLAHREEQVKDPGILAAVKQAKAEDLILHWGVSVYHPMDAMAHLEDRNIDIIQVPFNILDRRLLDFDFFEAARASGTQVMIRSVFLQGLLFLSMEQLAEKGMEWAEPALNIFHKQFDPLNVPLESFALQALSRRAGDAMIVIGVDTAHQLKKNIDSCRSPVIPPEMIDAWWRELPDFPMKLLNPSIW